MTRQLFRLLSTIALAACLVICNARLGVAEDGPAKEETAHRPAANVVAVPALSVGELLAPEAFRDAVAHVRPSLVTIISLAGVTPGKASGLSNPGEGPTTGLIVSPDGYIVTSTFNFLREPRVITVVLADKSQHVARLLGRDEIRKICLLKIDGVKDLPVARYAPPESLRVGQWAISAGVGYGDAEPAISAGIVSALKRVGGRAVQTDANISPANYGGPLLDIDGRVIGICVPLNPMQRGAASGVEWYDSGIGFAIPLHNADRLLVNLRDPKTIVRPAWLGVQPKPPAEAEKAGTTGVLVGAVQPNSPAAKAKLQVGDQIQAVDNEKLLDLTQFKSVLDRHVAGDRISLQVLRGGSTLTVAAELGAPPEAAKPSP